MPLYSIVPGPPGETIIGPPGPLVPVNDLPLTTGDLDMGGFSIIDMHGAQAALGLVGTPSYTFAGDLNTGIFSPGADQIAIVTGGSAALSANATHDVAIGGVLMAQPGAGVTTPGITFVGDLNTGVWSPSADHLSLVTGGVERISLDATGVVVVHNSLRTNNISGTTILENYLLSSDSQPAVRMLAGGQIQYGVGGSTAYDVSLARSSIGVLQLTGRLITTDGISLKTKAGALVDSDFTNYAVIAPPDGTLALNTTSRRLAYKSTSWLEVPYSGAITGVDIIDGADIATNKLHEWQLFNLMGNSHHDYWSRGTTNAPDGWFIFGTTGISRDPTNVEAGEAYASNVVTGAGISGLYQVICNTGDVDIFHYRSQVVTFTARVAVQGGFPTRLRALLADGVANNYSATYATSGVGYEVLTVTATVSASATQLICGLEATAGTAFTFIMGRCWAGLSAVAPTLTPQPRIPPLEYLSQGRVYEHGHFDVSNYTPANPTTHNFTQQFQTRKNIGPTITYPAASIAFAGGATLTTFGAGLDYFSYQFIGNAVGRSAVVADWDATA